MKLLLTRGGTAEFYEDDEENELAWASDSDPDWMAKHPGEFLEEDDVDTILDFLVEQEYLTDEE